MTNQRVQIRHRCASCHPTRNTRHLHAPSRHVHRHACRSRSRHTNSQVAKRRHRYRRHVCSESRRHHRPPVGRRPRTWPARRSYRRCRITTKCNRRIRSTKPTRLVFRHLHVHTISQRQANVTTSVVLTGRARHRSQRRRAPLVKRLSNRNRGHLLRLHGHNRVPQQDPRLHCQLFSFRRRP